MPDGIERMSWYDRHVLPRLLDLAMRHREVTRYRLQLIPRARGAVLEIGIGSGLNLPFYTADVQTLDGIDPSPELLAIAQQRTGATRSPVELHAGNAEALPFEPQSFDTIVTTFTLCSVAEPRAAVLQMRRVLKPGGRLLFAEHGLAQDSRVAAWQRRLNPVWKKFAGGCNLDRNIAELLQQGGFEISDLRREYANGPRVMSFVYSGEARAG
jgi:ubiquinone/menaquinone biosynthesis C-methylase UbiE